MDEDQPAGIPNAENAGEAEARSGDVMRPMEVLSLGAGIDSTVLALLSIEGALPRLDAAIFADTQREPASVYQHLEYLKDRFAEAGIPLHVVTAGDLGVASTTVEMRSGSIPVFILNDDGTQGVMRRQCTSDYKVAVIEKKLQEIRGERLVNQWIGIALEEVHRMRDNRRKYITNVFPLVDLRMSRWDCVRWLAARGITAPRSACYFCPYHSNTEWRRLRDQEPDEFAKAVQFEQELQAAHAVEHKMAYRGVPFLHRSMVPLDQVDLSTAEDHGQLTFGDCGVLCASDDEQMGHITTEAVA